MRAVVQRVERAQVVVADAVVGSIGQGLLVYAAAAPEDGPADVAYIADKVSQLRIFADEAGKMNRSASEVGGAVLLVSAFTVCADARRGRRPSFDASAPGPVARPLLDALVVALRGAGVRVETGRFAEDMRVESVNDGPICILLDSGRAF